MAEAVQETQHEFWRAPSPITSEVIVPQPTLPTMAEACPRCSTEFLLGSRFCHTCGGRRPEALSPTAQADAAAIAGLWEDFVGGTHRLVARLAQVRVPGWLRYLQFHEIKGRLGLATASLVAFFVGIGCVAGALLVGLLTAKTLVDWQAIQFYRAEWLLAATASFVAGILLKKSANRDTE
jgi:hypothetical protein